MPQNDPPRTQYDRNLTIRLEGGGLPVDSFTFSIKPGEFQSEHPARMSTTQTLQGVYQDFGGLGVQRLTYQGNTGWRRRAPNSPNDGFEVFRALYNDTYKGYHKRIQQADDPSQVKCLVIDDLYDTVYDVSLDDFQATKSKSSPLLYNYTLRMTVKSTSENGRAGVDFTSPSFANVASSVGDAINTTSQYNNKPPRSYTVQSGDSLQSIAQAYQVDPLKIAQANGLQPPYIFNAGIVLKIPY